jgi:hypothetical protein
MPFKRRVFQGHWHLDLIVAFFENFQAEIIAGLVVIGFLDHLDPGGLLRLHQSLRHLDRAVAVGAHVMHRPAAFGADAAKNLVVNFPAQSGNSRSAEVCIVRH